MRLSVMLLSTVVVLGCKGKPTKQEPPPTAAPVGSAPGSAGLAAPASIPNPNAPRPDQMGEMILPAQAGSAPNKTTAPLPAAKLKALSELPFDGWKTEVKTLTDKLVDVRHTTKTRPFVMVTANITPCTECIPMQLDKWKANEPALYSALPKLLRDKPGTKFEPGVLDFHGQPMIYTYHIGMDAKTDENDNPTAVYGTAYALYYNDGINSIRVVAAYHDMPLKDMATFAQAIPRETLEKAAKAFVDKYTHSW